MPRRPATIKRDIPLYLVPHHVLLGVRTHGEALKRVIVSKTICHFYTVSIRTRPVKRELRTSGKGTRARRDDADDGECV